MRPVLSYTTDYCNALSINLIDVVNFEELQHTYRKLGPPHRRGAERLGCTYSNLFPFSFSWLRSRSDFLFFYPLKIRYNTMKRVLSFVPASGWRRAGTFNLMFILLCWIVLLICIAVSVSRYGSSLLSSTLIFEGDCQTTKKLNLFLHLLLNLISTLILTSSGFFMQILSSPSREEIDRAHSQFRSLEIGVASLKNLRFISPIKLCGCIVLYLSSVPIHLVFNSSIFKTNYQGSEWGLTIASEAFATGEASIFPPGASLANAGTPAYGWDEIHANDSCRAFGRGGERYGEHIALAKYWDRSSFAYQNITSTATESRRWHNITARDCRAEYASCKPRKQYRDVVIMVDTGARSPAGWTRSEVFSDPHEELGPTWDSHVPGDDTNSLWYSTRCSTNVPMNPISFGSGTMYCIHNCILALGMGIGGLLTNMSDPLESNWTIPFNNPDILSACNTHRNEELGFNVRFDTFNVKYCLAEPSPDYVCQIGLSNILFFVTTICVFLKVATCALTLCYIPHTSLVALGDALESFIASPDSVTLGLGTFSIRDSHRLQFEPRKVINSGDTPELTSQIRPRSWHRNVNRLMTTIPRSIWSGTFLPVVFFIGVGVHFTLALYRYNGASL